uniref:ORFan n=1 Tax=Strongyloides papillosus TaxID=174720 RepID=A0A0N5C4K9_STREA
MGNIITTVCIVTSLIVIIIIIGLIVYYYYYKNPKNKKDGKEKSKSKASSSRSTKTRTKSPSSRRKVRSTSTASKKGTTSSRRRSSSRSGSTKSTLSKTDGSQSILKTNSATNVIKTLVNKVYPGEIQVEIPSKDKLKFSEADSKKLRSPKTSNKEKKKVSSDTPIPLVTDATVPNDKTNIESVNTTSAVKNGFDGNVPKVVEAKQPASVAFEDIPSGKSISNDLLKYKTNTHYIPPTSVAIPKEVSISSDVNPPTSNDLLKYKTNTHYIPPTSVAIPKEVSTPSDVNPPTSNDDSKTKSVPMNSTDVKPFTGSLLTTNNITFNNVNIHVHNPEESNVKDHVQENRITISEPDSETPNLPPLPSSTTTKIEEIDDDWVKL